MISSGNNSDISAQATGVDNIFSEKEKTRKENSRLARDISNKEGSINLLTLLFAFFFNADEKTISNGGTAEQLSNALNLDQEEFKQTTSDVISGKTSAFSAIITTANSTNPADINWDKANNISITNITGNDNGSILHPDLVRKMNNDPKVAQMVKWTLEAGEREGIDGKLLANQFWQESKFNPNAKSSAGALGIAQFMPHHKGKWGLETDNDFTDPKTSIEAGAKYMGYLTKKFGNNQQMALIAYNGGEGALKFVEENISNDKPLTANDWVSFMEQRQLDYKTVPELIARDKDNAWHNETLGYIKKIDSRYWSDDLIARAQQQSPTQIAFNNGGVDQRTDPVLTPKFNEGGIDQITLTAQRDAQIAASANERSASTPTSPT